MRIVCNIILFLFPLIAWADSFDTLPILSEGRYRPLYAYAAKEGKSVKELVDQELLAPAPNINRFDEAGNLRMLPYKSDPSIWIPLNALRAQNGNSENIENFTPYHDEMFAALQSAAFHYEKAPEHLSQLLTKVYQSLAGKKALTGTHSDYYFPSLMQLKVEELLYKIPLVPLVLFFYAIALVLFFGSKTKRWGWVFFSAGLVLHTLFLIARSYVLGRPPVSNMFETVVYVPWIALLIGLLSRQKVVLQSAIGLALILLSLQQASGISRDLENLQPVLNSQFWLIIHVLMVVASYGAFLLSGILAHIALLRPNRINHAWILNTLYTGTALLVTGTILGGVWAAESWGRFWDWDPKESWAFISACIYITVIHCYRFKLIGHYGLSIGSIIGLQAITFTWYGVNYILGAGLHSYGFGSGGEIYYYAFVTFEGLFITYFLKKDLLKIA